MHMVTTNFSLVYIGVCELLGSFKIFQVIEDGMFVKHCKVEVYLMELKLGIYDKEDEDQLKTVYFSKMDTVGKTKKCNIPPICHARVVTYRQTFNHVNACFIYLIFLKKFKTK